MVPERIPKSYESSKKLIKKPVKALKRSMLKSRWVKYQKMIAK